MLCADVMKLDLECLSPGDTVEMAARRMRDRNVGFLPICDESRAVQGALTDRDIAVRIVAEGLPGATLVEDVMSRDVVACGPTEDIRKAEELMAKSQKSRIMCVDDDGCLAGVISLSDIAQRDGARIAQTMRGVTEREART